MVIQASNFRSGLILKLNNELFQVVEFQHVNPGKGGAFVRSKLKNLKTRLVKEKTFKSDEKVEDVRLEKREMQYLYNEGDHYYFMDNVNYEQYVMNKDDLRNTTFYLIENLNVNILLYNNDPFILDLPNFVELKVLETEPGIKGDTAGTATKPAKCETGFIVNVPLFIVNGDIIKVDTRSASYVERIAK
jgi:elongation factor P